MKAVTVKIVRSYYDEGQLSLRAPDGATVSMKLDLVRAGFSVGDPARVVSEELFQALLTAAAELERCTGLGFIPFSSVRQALAELEIAGWNREGAVEASTRR